MTARTTISALTPRKTPPTPIQTKSDRLVRWPRARRYRSPRNSSKGRPRRLIQAPFERPPRRRPPPGGGSGKAGGGGPPPPFGALLGARVPGPNPGGGGGGGGGAPPSEEDSGRS